MVHVQTRAAVAPKPVRLVNLDSNTAISASIGNARSARTMQLETVMPHFVPRLEMRLAQEHVPVLRHRSEQVVLTSSARPVIRIVGLVPQVAL
jgi:hypothetical protein